MANITTRSSALAIKVESTEGTPVSPTAAGDYVALQDDFAMSPEFETLESAELRASIGATQPIVGAENPTASFSHYMRHSGVEGTAPAFDELLQAAFGAEAIRTTERDTVAGSTVTAINVDVGEGVEFQRGDALLVKDLVNGYFIAVVKSVSGDVLTPVFALENAPASGVNLGLSCTYLPANTHQTLSLWHYLGNSGAIQLISGARVTEMTTTIEAGQLINSAYSLEGLAYFKDAIEITATNKYIDFNDGAVQQAEIAEGFYKDPIELAGEIQNKLDAQSTDNITAVYSSTTGKFTLASDGATFQLLWATGAQTANSIGSTIGFDTAADDTGATSYEADNAIVLSSPQSPTFDSAVPLVAKSNRVMIGTQTDNVCFEASSITFTLTNERAVQDSVCSDSGRAGSLIVGRSVTVSVTALLQQYENQNFSKFRAGDEISFQYNFGTKTAGNWTPGFCGAICIPSAVINSYVIGDEDSLATLELELTGFVNANGEGEAYISFV